MSQTMKGLRVFDLQKFALHDGPGIRTTVFLKGCPLDCVWCHNPESKKCQPQLGFLEKNCTSCKRCQDVCPQGVHTFTGSGRHKIDREKCTQCGKCVDTCLNHALKMYGRQTTADAILREAMKDRDFFEKSGGGLTVSGGEPMMQSEGLMELLKKAKKEGLHVCLDTSGQAPSENYRAIAQYVDLFLFDYKITGAEEHKRYTGVENGLILRNLDLLCKMQKDIYLRCPIIPGINDNDIHFRAIADLSQRYDQIRQVNLMPYHDMAKGKAAQIGETYPLEGLKTMEAEEIERLYKRAEELGCVRLQKN